MAWAVEVADGFVHPIVFYDLIKIVLVLLPIPNSQGDAGFAKPSCSAYPVEVALSVSDDVFINFFERNVIIDNKLNLWNIDASGDQVGGDENVDLLLSEFLEGVISLFSWHLWEHDEGREACFSKLQMDFLGEV